MSCERAVLHRFDKYNAKADELVLLRAAGDRVGTRATRAARSSHPRPLCEIAAVASSILPVLQFNVLISDAQQYRGYLMRAWLVADQESIAPSCGGYPAFSQTGSYQMDRPVAHSASSVSGQSRPRSLGYVSAGWRDHSDIGTALQA
jgi:hypothetical protein